MKIISRSSCLVTLFALLSTLNPQLSTAFAQGTAFTYQGRLNDGSNPAQGIYDLKFTIYDDGISGSRIAGPLTNSAVATSNGLFTVTLDFGEGVFTGDAFWLEIGVRTNGGVMFATLSPRQQFTSTPYAIQAMQATSAAYAGEAVSATVAAGVGSGAVGTAGLQPGAVDASKIASGQVVKSLNGLADTITLAAGSNVSLTTLGSMITLSASASAQAGLPTGTIVFSQTTANSALEAAGYAAVTGSWNWNLAASNAGWTERYSCAEVAFNGRIWVLGGATTLGRTNDIWSSSDGTNWMQASSAAGWSPRSAHSALAFNGSIWVLNGSPNTGRTNDIWVSMDGTNYVLATNSAPWSPRTSAAAAVFDGKMWMLGGLDVNDRTNDVWSSTDGTNWTLVTSSAPWSGRNQHQALVFNGQLWVLGGIANTGATNDVWSSADGLNWTQVAIAAPWSARNAHAAVVVNGWMCVLGGKDLNNVSLNDVWCSPNGLNWTQATNSAPWSARSLFAGDVLNGQVWVFGGRVGTGSTNDAWVASPNQATLGQYFLFQKK